MSKCRCGQLKEVTHACIDYVLPELKCPHCRHVPHGDVCYALKGCRCHYNSHSPAEPKCADEDIHETPSSMMESILRTNHVHTAEPDATERAWAFHTIYEATAIAIGYETRADTKEFDPESKNGRLMIAACEAYRSHILEAETPRIKADAVREFIAEVEKEANRLMDASKSRYGLQSQISDHYPSAIQQVQARQVTKKMTEEV